MRPELFVIAGIFLIFTVLEIFRTGFFRKEGQRRKDAIVELVGSITLLAFTQPLILAAAYFLMSVLFPGAQGSWTVLPIIAQVALLLIFDDLTQYGWHRLSHSVPWLYALHRPHHDARYMSTRIVYRNNIFYYFLMPGIWFSGALIYLGLGWVYAFYIVVKMAVIISAHSDVFWDRKLYEIKWLSPIMWVVERTISTPSTHSAHHGRHAADGVTHYKGNFGNLLFFWDVLFGTAKITRKYPSEFGVENLPETSAGEQLLWPIIRDKKSASSEVTVVPAE